MPMTNISDLTNEIMRELNYYVEEVREKVELAKTESARELKKKIEQDSPKNRPRYAKGWRIKKTPKKLIIHNKTDYQLTHLLEHGHVLRNGDRFQGIPHIRRNEELMIRDFLEKIERAIQS